MLNLLKLQSGIQWDIGCRIKSFIATQLGRCGTEKLKGFTMDDEWLKQFGVVFAGANCSIFIL